MIVKFAVDGPIAQFLADFKCEVYTEAGLHSSLRQLCRQAARPKGAPTLTHCVTPDMFLAIFSPAIAAGIAFCKDVGMLPHDVQGSNVLAHLAQALNTQRHWPWQKCCG